MKIVRAEHEDCFISAPRYKILHMFYGIVLTLVSCKPIVGNGVNGQPMFGNSAITGFELIEHCPVAVFAIAAPSILTILYCTEMNIWKKVNGYLITGIVYGANFIISVNCAYSHLTEVSQDPVTIFNRGFIFPCAFYIYLFVYVVEELCKWVIWKEEMEDVE